MSYDRKLLAAKLQRWERYLKKFSLPEWDELPPFDLYMEQVISLLSDYLDFLLYESTTNDVITPSTVNNYVRMRIMPPPVKKRYTRVHLAYLIIICTLKQSLNIAYVQKMIPPDITEDEVKRIYNDFVHRHRVASLRFIDQLSEPMSAVCRGELEQDEIGSLVAELAVSANIYKLLTEKIVMLQGIAFDDLPEGEK